MTIIQTILSQFTYFFHLEYSYSNSFWKNIDKMIETLRNCSLVYTLLVIESFLIGSIKYPMILLCHFFGIISILFIKFTIFRQFHFSSMFLFYFTFYWFITFLSAFELHVVKPFGICFNVSMMSILLHSFFFHIEKKIQKNTNREDDEIKELVKIEKKKNYYQRESLNEENRSQ